MFPQTDTKPFVIYGPIGSLASGSNESKIELVVIQSVPFDLTGLYISDTIEVEPLRILKFTCGSANNVSPINPMLDFFCTHRPVWML